MSTDWRRARLEASDCAMLEFSEKLTREPGTMARSDLDAVRQAGFADRDLVTIAASAAFENFLGRVAAGVLVRLEEDLTPGALKPFRPEGTSAARPVAVSN